VRPIIQQPATERESCRDRRIQTETLPPNDEHAGGRQRRSNDWRRGNEQDSLDALNKLVDGERAKFPFLSRDQLFAKVCEQNPELFTKERQQSRARLAATLPAMPG
jgi:hypothetical protein